MRIEHPIEHPNEEAGAGGECLRAAGLTLRYGDTVALDGIDLTVASGEVVVLMGPSGCGKSSLLRSLMRLAGPDAGSIRFAGRELMGLPEPELRAVRREIGFVFQRFNLVQRLSAEQNVMLGLLAGGESPNRARARAAGALERVGLAHLAKRRPSEMSGGEQQRVGIARALALRPQLMLWDEPTAALDPMLCEEVLGVMEDLAASHETTMLIATHELPFAWRAADRIVLMEAGRIVDAGTPRAVLLEPKTALARRYRRMCEVRYGGLPAGWEGGPNGRSLLARAETL